MEKYLKKNFQVEAKNPSEEAQRRWRSAVSVVKNPRRRFRMVADLNKRAEAEKKKLKIQEVMHNDLRGLDEIVSSLENDSLSMKNCLSEMKIDNGVSAEKLQKLENEDLGGRVTRLEQYGYTIKPVEEERKVDECIDKIVTSFVSSLLCLCGFLGVLFTVTIPCKMFLFLVMASVISMSIYFGVSLYLIWRTKRQFNVVLSYTHQYRDVERVGDTTFHWGKWWSYVTPHVIKLLTLYVFFVTCGVILWYYVQNKNCAKEVTPSPSPVLDQYWSIISA